MRISIVGDLHFSGKKLQDKIEALSNAAVKMMELNTEIVIFTGDVFDRPMIGGREASTGTVYRAFMQSISDLIENDIEMHITTGNHDMAGPTDLSALEPLKDAGIQIAEKPYIDRMKYSTDNVIIAYLPWITDEQTIKKFFAEVKKEFSLYPTAYKILTGHAQIKGAVMNSGITLMGKHYEISPEELEELGANLIAFGHVHKRQKYYVGALIQSNFGEEGNPQGFYFIDTDEADEVTEIEIEAPKYRTYISTAEYAKIDVTSQGYTKLRIPTKPDNYNELIQNPHLTIEIIPEKIVNERKTEGIEPGNSTEDLLRSYLKARGEEDGSIERIIEIARGMEK